MLKKYILILQVFLLASSLAFAQEPRYLYVHGKALTPQEYDKSKLMKAQYLRLDQDEMFKAFGDSMESIVLEGYKYLYKMTYRNGTQEVFDAYETGIVGYYPELGLLVLRNCNCDYVKSVEDGEYIYYRGDPQYDTFSPSGKYMLTCILEDGVAYYTLFEKEEGEYIYKGNLSFHRIWVKDIYWVSDDELRFLGRKGEYWIPYSGKIKTEKPKQYY